MLSAVVATILSVLELTWIVCVVPYMVLQRRSPVATLAWIVVFAAMPLLGMILYFFVGPRRVKKNRMRRLRARLRVRAQVPAHVTEGDATSAPLDARAQQLLVLGTRAGDAPPSTCTSIRVLKNGVATYDAIEQAIAAAKHHVHVEYYIFDPDESGKRMLRALTAAAKRGVEVRVVGDAVGSSKMKSEHTAELREAGGRFAFFNRVTLSRWRPRLLNFRTHRKIVVCDGAVGFTGGINVTDTQNEAVLGAKAFRDTHLCLEGHAVRWLQIVFLEDWHYATGHAPRGDQYFPEVERGRHTTQILASGPDQDFEAIKNMYFAAIAQAQSRVLVTTPYFVPDEAILAAMQSAALRGVDVRLLVPRMSDSRVITIAARSYFDECLRAGVRIFEYLPGMLHAKTLVVDDTIAAIGTANMDNRSFRLNFEVSAIVHGHTVAATLASHFEEDCSHAREVHLRARTHLGLLTRFTESSARLLSPLL